ncbi:hypothetical protein AB0I00_13905 [Streptomyces sp. NPDC050803]
MTGTDRATVTVELGYRHGINLMTPGEPDLNRYPRRDTCPACAGVAP